MATAPTSTQIDPESLVARIIAELQANPEAQKLLLRTLLTDEFLGMPARLARMEADIGTIKADVGTSQTDTATLKTDVATLKTDAATLKTDAATLKTDAATLKTDAATLKTDAATLKTDAATLKTDVAILKTDVATLKGDSLEGKLHRRIRPLLSQRLGLRRARMMQGPFIDTDRELFGPVEEALDSSRISDTQEARISETDIILQATRKGDRAQIWVAVEASNNIAQSDIERVRQSAEALGVVFGQDTIAVVAGYNIHPLDQERAASVGVAVLLVEENN